MLQHLDEWFHLAKSVVSRADLPAVVSAINDFLALRIFQVGYSLSIADLLVWAQLQG